ncbi:MAG: hypothetical protein P4L99_25620 [Chthoniobacter sp.]|nr:hypothetical protein [Chthoniobacter sp.]
MNKPETQISEIAQIIVDELDYFATNFHPEGGERTWNVQHGLQNEPLIGYAAVVDAKDSPSTIFLCRHGIPLRLRPKRSDATYASYFSPLGRIITRMPGEDHEFVVRHGRTGLVLEDHRYKLLLKDSFRSHRQEDGKWDGVDNQFAWIGGQALARSLRGVLAGATDTKQPARSRHIRVELPDIAILDAEQDDLFRQPYNVRLRISGAPGTGKTTVLLKRLSQKTKYEFLTDDEKRLAPAEHWQDGQNWMLFTPSDLLKSYLKEALTKELLPAGDDHVKVYGTFRQTVLREIKFVGGGTGYFRASAPGVSLLKREERGAEHVLLNKAFGEALVNHFSGLWQKAMQRFNNETRTPLGQLADASQQVLIKGAELLSAAGGDVTVLLDAQRRFANFRSLNQSLNTVVGRVRAVGALQEADGTFSISFLYRKHLDLLRFLPTITAEHVEAALFPDIPRCVEALQKETRELAEAISVRRLFEQIPRVYQEFREKQENQERYFATETERQIREKQLTAPEQDTLLFHALEFYRTLHADLPADLHGIPNEIRNLHDRMRMLVAVDEVTDFSALEIACMVRFAAPRTGGVTICGDLLQRVTQQGLKTWDQLDELGLGFVATELNVSYRQTPRLFAIARDLFMHVTGERPNFRSAHAPHDGDPAPLWFRPTEDLSVVAWLVERIVEICDLCDGRLPTTAILVPQAADVAPLHSQLAELLQGHGIGVDASERGGALGDGDRVRIFPVEFIKGLEFEVVFYAGLDRMADIHKELVEKYFYVGLSRARSFLGVTCERSPKQLSQSLQCVYPHFVERRAFSDTTV